jgi:diadenosine tetraphosphate (Ap4A) HIT family hydrolase
VVPKAHFARVTDLPLELSRAVGEAVTRIGDAVTKGKRFHQRFLYNAETELTGMDNPDINIVCNQGYAQAVHHVHFHLVPAPINGSSVPPATVGPPSVETIFKLERDNRSELDDEDALIIVEKIRSKL